MNSLPLNKGNEIAGNLKYANRPLEVTGRIRSPEFDAFAEGKIYVVSLISNDLMWAEPELVCRLRVTSFNTNWVTGLTEGDAITVRGNIRDVPSFGDLDLRNCLPIAP